jgi:hypothetical protein
MDRHWWFVGLAYDTFLKARLASNNICIFFTFGFLDASLNAWSNSSSLHCGDVASGDLLSLPTPMYTKKPKLVDLVHI